MCVLSRLFQSRGAAMDVLSFARRQVLVSTRSAWRWPHERFFLACVTLAGVFPLAPRTIDAQQTAAAQRPELAVLYTIDGFSDKAPGRVTMPNFQALVAQGAYFRQNWTVHHVEEVTLPQSTRIAAVSVRGIAATRHFF
jgi:hypothetical protein